MSISNCNNVGITSTYVKACSLAPSFVDPSSIDSLQLWYKYRTGLETIDGKTDVTTFADLDTLLNWEDQVNSNHAINSQNWNRPKWNLLNQSCAFLNSKHWDFTSPFTVTGDFTFSYRLKFTGLVLEGLLGSDNANYFELTDPNTFTADIGGWATDNVFVDTSTIVQGAWYTVHFVRESGVIYVYVDGGANNDKMWGGVGLTDNDPFTVAGIGSWGDGSQELSGIIKDFSYFNTALTTAERANMNNYLQSL